MLTGRFYNLVAIAALLAVAASSALAGERSRKGGAHRLQAGNSTVGHLYLHEKDPETWEIIEGGAWGKMTYRISGPAFKFVFNGHHLEPEWSYTLMYYPDPWPGDRLICLGEGVADRWGDVHIMNSVDTGDLPAPWDENQELGAKIWLVLTADVDCDMQYMTGWNPTEYLFEHQGIFFTQTTNKNGGSSNVRHLYLFEKDPETWDIVPDGAWGKMTYRRSGPLFWFVFNGHHLEPDWSYTLIYYPDPWPGAGLICLGEAMAKGDGDVHIKNKVETGTLPAPWDENQEYGAKLWLVKTADVDCEMESMIGWDPTEYLFEYEPIFFTDTDE